MHGSRKCCGELTELTVDDISAIAHYADFYVNVPPNTYIGHIGDGFYGSEDPTNSVKALKEEKVSFQYIYKMIFK